MSDNDQDFPLTKTIQMLLDRNELLESLYSYTIFYLSVKTNNRGLYAQSIYPYCFYGYDK